MITIFIKDQIIRSKYQEEIQNEVNNLKLLNDFSSFIKIELSDFQLLNYTYFDIITSPSCEEDIENQALVRNYFNSHNKYRML